MRLDTGKAKSWLAALALGALGACGGPGSGTAPVLSYEDAFIMAPIGGRDVTMGGVTLSIQGGEGKLIGASSDAFDAVEIHTMSMRDGKMQMRKVDSLDIAEGKPLVLRRGGDHLMLFGASPGLEPGGSVDIMLNFDTGASEQTLIVEAEIRSIGD